MAMVSPMNRIHQVIGLSTEISGCRVFEFNYMLDFSNVLWSQCLFLPAVIDLIGIVNDNLATPNNSAEICNFYFIHFSI